LPVGGQASFPVGVDGQAGDGVAELVVQLDRLLQGQFI